MTLMPDLPTAGRGLPLPALGVPGGPGPAPARERGEQVRPTEPAAVEESAAGRAETRRLMADRYALETQTRTAEGLRAALAETSRRVQPQVADVRELSARPRPSDEASARALEDARLAARLREAMARMSTNDRTVLVLRHFSELSYQEIAQVLELDEKTVKSRLHEARSRLRGMLGDLRAERR